MKKSTVIFRFLLFYFKNIFESTIIYFEIKARDMRVQVIRNEKEGKEKKRQEQKTEVAGTPLPNPEANSAAMYKDSGHC